MNRVGNLLEILVCSIKNSVESTSFKAWSRIFKISSIRWNFVVPRTHEISNDIFDSKELFSQDSQKEIDKIVKISKKLRREYEISLYGDRDDDKSLNDLYTKEQALEYINNSKFVYDLCYDELKDFLEENLKSKPYK